MRIQPILALPTTPLLPGTPRPTTQPVNPKPRHGHVAPLLLTLLHLLLRLRQHGLVVPQLRHVLWIRLGAGDLLGTPCAAGGGRLLVLLLRGAESHVLARLLLDADLVPQELGRGRG